MSQPPNYEKEKSRWEDGFLHHPLSEQLMEWMMDVNFKTGDSLCLKKGGDGDNGETLMYLMDGFFERHFPVSPQAQEDIMSYEHRLVESNQGKNEHLDKIGREADAEIAKLKAHNAALLEVAKAAEDFMNIEQPAPVGVGGELSYIAPSLDPAGREDAEAVYCERYDALHSALNAARAAGAME